jgi:hypothetical protein
MQEHGYSQVPVVRMLLLDPTSLARGLVRQKVEVVNYH